MTEDRREPRWVPRLVVDAVHHDTLATHGGLAGVRDEALLESTLARPRQRFAHEDGPDLAALAAAYGYGLARNHPFQDGNKRVAFIVMAVFTELNGFEIDAEQADVVQVMLASGEMTEEQLAEWVRESLTESGRKDSARRSQA